MTTTATRNFSFLLVSWSQIGGHEAALPIVGETDKAWQLREERGTRTAWFPKSAFKAYILPKCFNGDRIVEKNELVVADWFKSKASNLQARILGV